MNGRDEVVHRLESGDLPLPDDSLTVEKIKDRAEQWVVEDDSIQFQIERHQTPCPRFSKSPTGATPARWHEPTQYSYDRTTGSWDTTTLDSEFRFDPHLLIQAEFDGADGGDAWAEKINRVQNSPDQEETLNEEFEPIEEMYSDMCHAVPDEKVEEMLTVLKDHFRKKAGL